MNKITIKKALAGTDFELPKEVERNKKIRITLPDQEIRTDSLVFFTERLNVDTIDAIAFKEVTPYAMVVNKHALVNCNVPAIKVDSVRRAFANACSNMNNLNYSKLKIIGITGTNGKTTTATLIFEMLKYAGYSVGFIGTGKICINDEIITDNTYSMTTPDPTTLYSALNRMYSAGCEYIVMEVSSHSISLEKIYPIHFEYSVFTNLTEEHLDFHKSIEEYYQTKLSLFKQTKRALFNLDDKYSRRAYEETDCIKTSIGIIHPGNAYASDIDFNKMGSSFFYYREKNFTFSVKSKLSGAFNIYNILCALKCVIDLGMKPCIAKRALESIDRIDGRMQLIKSDITIVVDYAHTPNALYNLLNSLICSNIYRQNLTVVFGCGGNRDKFKRSAMGKIASKYANKIILTEDNNRNENFCEIISDIVKGVDCAEYLVIKDREDAIKRSISEAKTGDIIAIVGKGHEKYKITSGETIPFDEEAIIKEALYHRSIRYENLP